MDTNELRCFVVEVGDDEVEVKVLEDAEEKSSDLDDEKDNDLRNVVAGIDVVVCVVVVVVASADNDLCRGGGGGGAVRGGGGGGRIVGDNEAVLDSIGLFLLLFLLVSTRGDVVVFEEGKRGEDFRLCGCSFTRKNASISDTDSTPSLIIFCLIAPSGNFICCILRYFEYLLCCNIS